jgi:SGNH domain (fused to AT3 domains)
MHGEVPRTVRLLRRRLVAALTACTILLAGPPAAAIVGHSLGPSGSASVIAADVKASLSIQSLPTNLSPSLSAAVNDTALVDTPSLSNCNVTGGGIHESECIFGDTSGTRTMVLWGDSHAFMWFPALNAVATAAHWKLVAMMEFGCPVADVSVWNPLVNAQYSACNKFRSSAISLVNKLKPSVLIVTEEFTSLAASAGGQSGTISVGQWGTALEKTLKLVHARHKVVLGSTVTSGNAYPPQCLAANPSAVQKCTISDTPAQQSERAAEARAAKAVSATYVNVLPWLCSSSVAPGACSAIIGDETDGYRVVYYAAGHLTETYDLFLRGVLATALKHVM